MAGEPVAAGEAACPEGVRPSDSPHRLSTVPPLLSGSPKNASFLGCPRGWHVPQGEHLSGGAESEVISGHFEPFLTATPVSNSGLQSFSPDFDGMPDPELMAALCEMAAWQAPDKATRDSLLLSKAAYLAEAGQSARAYETVCRIQRFGLSEEQRAELLRRKLIYSWEAGLMDDFQGLLEEAPAIEGKLRHRSEDLAMILSVLPGAGLAYAGEWAGAGKYFLAGSASIALGVGAFLSGLYVSSFLGGGMLLYTILPSSTEKAVRTVSEYNDSQLLGYYSRIIEKLKDSPETD